ncbi:MAG TPA: hypothetical protein VL094_10965 [Sphingomonadaceae bacterium]|nr:hypothetical protein [Sphingomonadaceae bacterium]
MKVLAAGLVASATFVGSHALQAQSVADQAAELVQWIQGLVGSDYGGGVVIKAIRAEGEIVVIRIDGPENWRGDVTASEISYALLTGLCSTAPTFFDSGIKLRVDTTEIDAKPIPSPVETACPPPE